MSIVASQITQWSLLKKTSDAESVSMSIRHHDIDVACLD